MIALITACVVVVTAQRGSRPNPAANQGTLNDETFRELMKHERENKNTGGDSAATTQALLKQIIDDFRSIQNVNNKMMADVFAKPAVDYDKTSAAILQINTKATRLKNSLTLPNPKDVKKRDLNVSGAKEFKSALLLMDHSIMSFVNNPIFKEGKVMEVESATQASNDLADVITLSATLKKIADNLKISAPRQ